MILPLTNIEALKTIIARNQEEFSRMPGNAAKTFEQKSKDTAQSSIEQH
jgi:hypothetical protein